ncbi:MAG: hypothetical protein UZ15_CFX003001903 [Chloroflexi bacterium OLB15]|nr:MAG: hypothetical protein UZ15_CFX003001903 [Chloroflexi bacterium OLB15]
METNVLTAEATVATANASKIMKWLCGHFKMKVPAEYNDVSGHVNFPFGVCTMTATDTALLIRVQAPDAESFERVKLVVSDHLERFGRKEALTVVWQN